MQGKKQFTPQLFYSTGIDELVAQNNFYRRLNAAFDLHFVYKATAKYYGAEGQQSIRPSSVFQDPVGRLFKPYQQRPGLYYCADSLSIRLFLGYHLDEQLPWHSTISRTRQLYGEEVFLSLLQEVHKPLYDQMHQKLTEHKAYHRRLVKRRSCTVEPVLGTLINHHNMKRLNSGGMAQANKQVLMAALTCNLKKYLKFSRKTVRAMVVALSKRKYDVFIEWLLPNSF